MRIGKSCVKKSRKFAEKTDSIFHGIVVSIGGLAIRIKHPVHWSISDPGIYFYRKGFHCHSAQVYCDNAKQFLWITLFNKGAINNSVAFTDSSSYDLLLQKADKLLKGKLYLIGELRFQLFILFTNTLCLKEIQHVF